ncbi:FHA domain-containing protein [Ruegeria lacuscaerulensis]|uniref:FHA domain-containing protein n=1 Tax=Ruegeria lacuscaerulensis TaxID=55218 RepID=UPI00147F3F80|nr:FHA domain-containing protein [Ruegeria lacuscaerulensis]
MFKYKSPLSRLLEGAGKPKEAEAEDIAETSEDKPEPIADFNALRVALAGNNMPASDSYDEAEDLIPEAEMPDFSEADAEDSAETDDAAILADVVDVLEPTEEPAAEEEIAEEDPIVTLHVASDEEVGEAEEENSNLFDTTPADPVIEVVAEDPAPESVAEIVEAVDLQPEPLPNAPAAQMAETPSAAQPAQSDRRGRVKTTFLGFERADTHVQDLMETAEPVAKTETAQQTFPVGWLVVTGGPGRGACITLTEGLMQIGRNDDQAIQLDFGDTGISRSNHAVIAYDPEDRKCYLGHGGKANLVRLNGKPVLSTVALASGDLIRISETSIRFAEFCGDNFDWRDA